MPLWVCLCCFWGLWILPWNGPDALNKKVNSELLPAHRRGLGAVMDISIKTQACCSKEKNHWNLKKSPKNGTGSIGMTKQKSLIDSHGEHSVQLSTSNIAKALRRALRQFGGAEWPLGELKELQIVSRWWWRRHDRHLPNQLGWREGGGWPSLPDMRIWGHSEEALIRGRLKEIRRRWFFVEVLAGAVDCQEIVGFKMSELWHQRAL